MISENSSLSCGSTEKWSFGAPPAGVSREYISESINFPGVGSITIVISSNVRSLNQDSDLITWFNVDIHSELWECKPLLLSSFVSSPATGIHVDYVKEQAGELSLYLLDASDNKHIRKITLLHNPKNLADAIKSHMEKYDSEHYNQEDAVYARLSEILGLGK